VDATGQNIVLIVDGVLIRDDAQVILTIHEKAQRLMDTAQELNQAIQGFTTSIHTFINDVEQLLTQPQPDIQAAVASLNTMRDEVDAEAAKVQAVLHPDVPPQP